MVFPFSFDVAGQRSAATFAKVWEEYQRTSDLQSSEQPLSYNWIWAIGRLATICFYLGKAEEGYQVLKAAAKSLGPFLAPNEHYRREGGAFLPWFGTGAGAFVYALNAMFVQVYDEGETVLLPAVPRALGNASFSGLLADRGVRLSGHLEEGRLKELSASCQRPTRWAFRIREAAAEGFERRVRLAKPADGWVRGSSQLAAGTSCLLRSKG